MPGGNHIILDTVMWNEFDFSFNIADITAAELYERPSPAVTRVVLDLVSGTVWTRFCLKPSMVDRALAPLTAFPTSSFAMACSLLA